MNIFNLILQSTIKAEYQDEYNQQGNINGSVAQDSRLTTSSDGYRMYIFPESPETLKLPLDTENIIMSSTPEGIQISRTDRNAINNPYYQNNQDYVNPVYNQNNPDYANPSYCQDNYKNNMDYANPSVVNERKSRTVAIGRIPDPKNTKEISKKEDKKDEKEKSDSKKSSSSVKSNKTQKAKNSCIGLKNNIDFIYAIGFSLLG